LSNPDECPGCNKCSAGGDPTSGWQINEDRGSIPQDIYVEAGVRPQEIGDGINIPNGRTLSCAAIWMEHNGCHLYVENGGAIYVYEYGSVPGF